MLGIIKVELDIIVNYYFTSKYSTSTNNSVLEYLTYFIISCDTSNIIHSLAHKHLGIYSINLICNTTTFLKSLAANIGYLIVPILDKDMQPQSKCDTF